MNLFNRKPIVRTAIAICSLSIATQALATEKPDFVVAVQKNPPTMEPSRENKNVAMRIIYNVLDTLIDIDFNDDFKLIPGLATSWKRIDDKTVEFKLRTGVKCHNGEDFDADDVAFSFGPKRLAGEGAPGYPVAKQYLGGLQGVEIIDSHTVRISSKKADPLLEQRMSNYMGQLICKDAFLAANNWDEWSLNIVGTGPYKLTEIKTGEHIKLEAFDGYWGNPAPAKTVTFKIVPEVAARIAGLTTGEFDIVTEIPPDQLKDVDETEGVSAVGGAIRNIRSIDYDKTSGVLANPLIRQALNLAIDRQLIVEALFNGMTTVPLGMQQELFGEMYLKDWPALEYNPEKARALVKEANYKGEVINYRVLSNYYALELSTAQILLEMWKEVGLNVTLDVKENWSQIEADDGRGIHNASNTAVYPDPVAQLWRRYGPNGGMQSRGEWSNEEFNNLGEVLETSTDLSVRRDTMRKMLEIFHNTDPAATPLYALPMFYGKQDRFEWKALGYEYMSLRAENLKF
ncbi:MAG: ABC transporter substrate-binding protein [Pseudomonadales bacterium]